MILNFYLIITCDFFSQNESERNCIILCNKDNVRIVSLQFSIFFPKDMIIKLLLQKLTSLVTLKYEVKLKTGICYTFTYQQSEAIIDPKSRGKKQT